MKHTLEFITPGGTSRGVLTTKDSYILIIKDKNGICGIGECSIIPRLSIDDIPEIEQIMHDVQENIWSIIQDESYHLKYLQLPAVRFAIEMAKLDYQKGGKGIFFPSQYTFSPYEESIPINGLLWMGSFDYMWEQAQKKAEEGFSVLKMKVGALNFDEERYFIKHLRKSFPKLNIRLDANGGFPNEEALDRLESLAEFSIHSIEQPIKVKQYALMSELCRKSPIPIALDEELIGVLDSELQKKMLNIIQPQFIIIKPSLLGGFRASDEWIAMAEERKIGWWATSALESNIALNAIAQWVYTKKNSLPQGLGTGNVFKNNFSSQLYLKNGKLFFKGEK